MGTWFWHRDECAKLVALAAKWYVVPLIFFCIIFLIFCILLSFSQQRPSGLLKTTSYINFWILAQHFTLLILLIAVSFRETSLKINYFHTSKLIPWFSCIIKSIVHVLKFKLFMLKFKLFNSFLFQYCALKRTRTSILFSTRFWISNVYHFTPLRHLEFNFFLVHFIGLSLSLSLFLLLPASHHILS